MKTKIVFLATVLVIIFLTLPLHGLEREAEVIGSRVKVHTAPDGDSGAVIHLNSGVIVEVLGRTETPSMVENFKDYWYLVGYRDESGWVFGQFLHLKSNKRGIMRLFTREELLEYCEMELRGLANIFDAGAYRALKDSSLTFLYDLKDMTEDKILSHYARDMRGYRAAATYYLALSYIMTGDIAQAIEVRDIYIKSYHDMVFSDGRTSEEVLSELNKLIEESMQSP